MGGALPTRRNPYKGLRPFSEADAGDFFGRAELLGRLVERLLGGAGPARGSWPWSGRAGAGKSSVVRAGLVPAIRAGALGDAGSTFVAEMFPGPHPIDELAAALLRIAVRADAATARRLESGLAGPARRASDRSSLPATAEILLVIDQFEEVFTLARDEAERERFLEALRVATARPGEPAPRRS